ncbi:hypothetical protein J3R82DRAFT_3033 [Butyriboletus roseoflavus]|nr:hypothetical protein J3R82DRAFT_3033 [Butyriboletus roseoflavus]
MPTFPEADHLPSQPEDDRGFDPLVVPGEDISARIPIEAAAAEMVPDVLQPPLQENALSISLLTPSRPVAVTRPLSEGSEAANSAVHPKRRRKQVSPFATPPMPWGLGVTLRIPGRTHIPSVLERLVSSTAPPAPPPVQSMDGALLCSFIEAALKSADLQGDPARSERFTDALSVLAPGCDLLPNAPLVVRSIPSNPVLLDGHDLGFPTTVISVMQANWSTHIPLNVLTTHALLASADDAYQNVVIGEGGWRILPPKLNEKDEPLMTYQEWFHVHPRLATCIRKYLPRYGDEVADMWEKHFAVIFSRIDFFENFHLYLQYDILIRRRYVSDTSLNPAIWHSKVWLQIINGATI